MASFWVSMLVFGGVTIKIFEPFFSPFSKSIKSQTKSSKESLNLWHHHARGGHQPTIMSSGQIFNMPPTKISLKSPGSHYNFHISLPKCYLFRGFFPSRGNEVEDAMHPSFGIHRGRVSPTQRGRRLRKAFGAPFRKLPVKHGDFLDGAKTRRRISGYVFYSLTLVTDKPDFWLPSTGW